MFEHTRTLLARQVPQASDAFLGLGALQTWVGALQAAAQVALAADAATAFGRVTLFVDMGSVPAFPLVIALARRLVPLGARRVPLGSTVALMYASNVLVALGPALPTGPERGPLSPLAGGALDMLCRAAPDVGSLAVLAGLVLVGAGSSLFVLHWWELYAFLNPIEVAFATAAPGLPASSSCLPWAATAASTCSSRRSSRRLPHWRCSTAPGGAPSNAT